MELKEVTGPDSTYMIRIEASNDTTNDVLNVLTRSFPESVSVDLVKQEGDTTKIIAHSRENALISELRELQEDGKLTTFQIG